MDSDRSGWVNLEDAYVLASETCAFDVVEAGTDT